MIRTGRLIVVPHCERERVYPQRPFRRVSQPVCRQTPWGSRWFRHGDRLTNPVHQWPDPEIYVHYPSGDLQPTLKCETSTGLFRAPDGGFTERVAYALTELVRKENATMTLDLHEARPMNPIVNCIIANERAAEIAAMAVMDRDAGN